MGTPHLCDLLSPLVRDVTNYRFQNRNDYTIPRCRLSLYKSSFIPSVTEMTTLSQDVAYRYTNLCVCGYISEDASHFLLNCRLYIEQRTILFNFLLISYRLIFLYHKCLHTYYPSCSLSYLCLYDTERTSYKL